MNLSKYYKIIKELQLNGTLDCIREEIRLNNSYKVIHFMDKLIEYLNVDKKFIEEINFIYYDLLTKDKEFIKSYKKYTDKIDAIKKEKDDAYSKEISELIKKAKPETKQTIIDLLKKYL